MGCTNLRDKYVGWLYVFLCAKDLNPLQVERIKNVWIQMAHICILIYRVLQQVAAYGNISRVRSGKLLLYIVAMHTAKWWKTGFFYSPFL